MPPSTSLTLVAMLALGLAVNASVERLCLNACKCRLTFSQTTALLNATCNVEKEFPSINDANVSVVLLSLGDGDPLKALKDFRCENCHLDGIDLDTFEGISDIDSNTLAGGVLVELQTEELEGASDLVLQLTRSDVGDCDAFLREFSGLRPKVKVVGCAVDDDNADSYEEHGEGSTSPQTKVVVKANAVLGGENETTLTSTPTDAGRRDFAGDLVIEDTDEVTVAPRVDGIQPLVPVLPDEDPATVFSPWAIAVIICVGAIIVAVSGYYIWQKWTDIRSCCCGGEYQRP